VYELTIDDVSAVHGDRTQAVGALMDYLDATDCDYLTLHAAPTHATYALTDPATSGIVGQAVIAPYDELAGRRALSAALGVDLGADVGCPAPGPTGAHCGAC
jgi:hypothetical protein